MCSNLTQKQEQLSYVDRRVGKKRILNMAEKMKLKHPILQFFYELRLSTL